MKKLVAALVLLASPSFAAEQIHVVEHAKTDATATIGKAKHNRADILTFANPVFDAADKRQVGTDNGFCVRTVAGQAYECVWTVKLADGQIAVEGPFHDSGDTVLAITGGTGRYAQARGEMKLHARDAKGMQYDFVYALQ
jgi:hypothetical protein